MTNYAQLVAENKMPIKDTSKFSFMHLKKENGNAISREDLLEWLAKKCRNGSFSEEYRKIRKDVNLNTDVKGKKSTVEEILRLLRLVRNYDNANEMLHAEIRLEEAVRLTEKKNGAKHRRKAVEAD